MSDPPVKVLLIEDDEDDFVLVRDLLGDITARSYDLKWFRTYDAALESICSGVYDVCLLDYHLGSRDGLELLKESVASGCRTPTIFLTGLGDYQADVNAMKAGAVDFLLKDEVSGPLLERSIRYALQRKRVEDELRLDDTRSQSLLELGEMTDASAEDIEAYALERSVVLTRSEFALFALLNPEGALTDILCWPKDWMRKKQVNATHVQLILEHLGIGANGALLNATIINDYTKLRPTTSSPPPDLPNLCRIMAMPISEQNRTAALFLVANKDDDYDASDERYVGLIADSMRKLLNSKRDRDALARSELQLRESNRLLQKVFDGISDPLVMVDKEFLVVMLNKAARDYYAVNQTQEVVGKTCYEGLAGRAHPCDECGRILSDLKTKSTTFERKGLRNPGRCEQVAVYAVRGAHGQRDSAIVRISDITEMRVLERQLVQNEKLASLGLLVSSIAHEINNPNTFIAFNLPILRQYLQALIPIFDEYADSKPGLELFHMPYTEFREDLFKLMDNMENGSSRIASIISNLKRFARKQDSSDFKLTDLRALVDQTVAVCMPEIRKSVKSFSVVVPEDLPKVNTNPEAVQHIMVNLLINATHACDKEDSRVRVLVRFDDSEDRSVIIEVSDNGTGMDDSIKERVFDPFFTTKGPTSGTGLGLYVSYNLVEGLGGRIEIDTSPGEGSTFRVILPAPELSRVP